MMLIHLHIIIHFFVFVCSSSFDLFFLKVAQFNDSALQRVFPASGGSAQVLPSVFSFTPFHHESCQISAVLICYRNCGPTGVLGTREDACLAIGLNRRAS
jgi:hypothetical protein